MNLQQAVDVMNEHIDDADFVDSNREVYDLTGEYEGLIEAIARENPGILGLEGDDLKLDEECIRRIKKALNHYKERLELDNLNIEINYDS